MPLPVVDRLCGMLADAGVNYAGVTGGEPTLHPQFGRIAEAILSYGLDIHLKSNGIWPDSIERLVSEIDPQRISFLLGVLPREDYRAKEWEKLRSILRRIPSAKCTLGITILSPMFCFDHIVDLASEFGIGQVRWALAHPSTNDRNTPNSSVSISDYALYADRLVDMSEALFAVGARTVGDHSSILCMWNVEQERRLDLIGSTQITTCEPTVDFLPDGKAAYCLPLAGLFSLDANSYDSLDMVVAYFDKISRALRSCKLPFSQCETCESYPGICHGGCFAHKSLENATAYTNSWTTQSDSNRVLELRHDLEVRRQNQDRCYLTMVTEKGRKEAEFIATEDYHRLLQYFDGNTTIGEIQSRIMADCRLSKEETTKILDKFLLISWSYETLAEYQN